MVIKCPKCKSKKYWQLSDGRLRFSRPKSKIPVTRKLLKIVPGIEAKDLQPLIEKQVKKGSIICSDGWRGYTSLAAKGYVHRLVDHSENEYSDGKGNHINGLEGFWDIL